MARVLIAATRKSSGKTTLSIGLVAALAHLGNIVHPFKKGPDYIDPMWLARAAKRPCYNLDFNTMTPAEIATAFAKHSGDVGAISLIEANKGLFDGVDPLGSDSNAALAKLLHCPVVLVINTQGISRGIAPLLCGYADFDADVTIKGVILNMVAGARHEAKLRAAVEHYTDIPVLGALARDRALAINERHLGLTTPGEVAKLDDKIKQIANIVQAGVDVAKLQELAQAAPSMVERTSAAQIQLQSSVPAGASKSRETSPTSHERPCFAQSHALPIRIGVARDAAFGFYYPDDLQALKDGGAQIILFNTLQDVDLPDVDALFIGGGFPETQARALAQNASLRAQIKQAIEAGMPAYAECGGLMYLSHSLTWNGDTHAMVGVLNGNAVMHARPQGRGHVLLRETVAMPWPKAGATRDRLVGNQLPTADIAGAQRKVATEASHQGPPAASETHPHQFAAHEFHYASLDNLDGNTVFAMDVLRGHGVDGAHDGIVIHNLLANFAHQRDTGANRWTSRFLAFIRAANVGRGGSG